MIPPTRERISGIQGNAVQATNINPGEGNNESRNNSPLKGQGQSIGHSTFYGHRKAASNKFPQINRQAVEGNSFTNTSSSKE